MHHGKAISSGAFPAETEEYIGDFSGHTIVFLDVDGVLNNSTTRDRVCHMVGLDDRKIAILKEIVDFLNADIILSSSWKENWHKTLKAAQDEFADALDERLAAFGLRIADRTYDSGFDRGKGILEWIRIHGPLRRYVILDDERFDFRELKIGRHWIQTSWYGPGGGIGENHLRYIRKHLGQFI